VTQTLNLASQCLDNWANRPVRDPDMLRLMHHLSRELVKAPKFLLPEGGRPIDDPASVARMYSELRLPYPCVALEYLASGPIGEAEVTSRRRIALAWSLDAGAPPFVRDVSGLELGASRGILVQSISYIDQVDMWMPIFGMVHVDLSTYPGKKQPAEIPKGIRDLTEHRMRTHGATETYAASAIVTVDRILAEYGEEAAGDLIAADSGDEVLAVLSFAALTMCGNVSGEVIQAPAALNRKRAAKGKSPIFDTRVLMVADTGGYKGAAQSAAGGSGMLSHASPRAHLRRGHIRRLADTRNVWVNAAVVNPHRSEAPVPRYEMRRERGG
jgi:hypothetical protein